MTLSFMCENELGSRSVGSAPPNLNQFSKITRGFRRVEISFALFRLIIARRKIVTGCVVFARRANRAVATASNAFLQIDQFDEVIGLTAQLIGDHGR